MAKRKPVAEWIVTFDDGPLPSDVTTWTRGRENDLLKPLRRILKVLREHPRGPIPSVFFLRGPAYPWGRNRPPDEVFRRGVRAIERDGHAVAVHCFSHNPDLWWNWLLTGSQIHRDLDRAVGYFQPMARSPLTTFRPPYGQGGLPGVTWAVLRRFKYHRWDVDSEDWLHHPDVDAFLRRFENDPQAHLRYILETLPLKMWIHTVWPGPNDVLLHVSERTAGCLDRIIDRVCEVTQAQGHRPQFVAPQSYLSV
jgi:peptidoglycan/xylan/chitin deacetylase (PgdA/CDA1 family)